MDTIIKIFGQGRAHLIAPRSFLALTLLAATSLTASGCGLLSDSPAPLPAASRSEPQTGTTDVWIRELPAQRDISDIEVIFEPPVGTFEGILIQYGSDPSSLSFTQRFPRASWKPAPPQTEPGLLAAQPQRFSCIIREIPTSQRVFIKLAAYQGEAVFAFTDTIEIE